jgi:Peptidase family M23
LALLLAAPAIAAPYSMPLRGNDLSPGERFGTGIHASGIQAEGQDIGGRRHVSNADWPSLVAGKADTKINDNYIIHGKPFYAMADGVVIGCWRNAPENIPGEKRPEVATGRIAGGGNHLWIRQDDGVTALYAHAIPGSIPATLCPHNDTLLSDTTIIKGNPDIRKSTQVTNGAHVKVGQMLGRVGNSGSSSGPHLHIHMERDDKPVKITFDRGLTTPFDDGKANINGPWTPIAGKQLPRATILVWPPYALGTWTFNGIKDEDYQRHFDHMANSGEMLALVTCKNNGATYDTKWVPASGQWVSFFGMTPAIAAARQAEFTGKGYTRVSNYNCGSRSVAVWRK